MASGYRVTEDEWRAIKSKLTWHKPSTVAQQFSRHLAIVIKIQSSNSYAQYRKIVKAEHPPQTKNSLKDEVESLKNVVSALKEELERVKTYLALELSHDCD